MSETLPAAAETLPAASTTVLAARALRKAYGRRVAVDGVGFEVAGGEVVGLLGPNGAGKTTTIKMLLGLVRPDGGEATIFGRPAGDPAARKRIGYLPELFRYPEWLSGAEVVRLHGRLAGMPKHDLPARVTAVLAEVGLAGRGDDKVKGYSKGMSQRLGLAVALVAHPDLVLLDEPTSALDPLGRREVRDLIRRLRERGAAVLLNSHLLAEVEQVCDRVVILDQGRVVSAGRLEDLAGALEVRVELDRIDEGALALLAGFGEIVAVDRRSGEVLVAADDGDAPAAIADALVRAGYRLRALVPLQRTLEEVFVDLVEATTP